MTFVAAFLPLRGTFSIPLNAFPRATQCGIHYRSGLLQLAIKNKVTRPRCSTSERLLHSQTATPVKPTQLRLQPILQFLSSRIHRATHRTWRVQRASSGGSPFGPPGPRGPWRRFRDNIDEIPSAVILWGVLIINGLVFATWQFGWAKYQSTGDPSTYLWLRDNFTVSMNNIKEGRIWTLLTSAFSHEGTMHLFVNAFTYYFMAPAVLAILGNSAFLGLYLGGGLVTSLASVWWNNNVRKNPNYASHGASGAVYAVISFFACVAPTVRFLIFGIIPVPAWLCVSGIFLFDSYGTLHDNRPGTDTAGHVGGLLAGIGYFIARRFRIL